MYYNNKLIDTVQRKPPMDIFQAHMSTAQTIRSSAMRHPLHVAALLALRTELGPLVGPRTVEGAGKHGKPEKGSSTEGNMGIASVPTHYRHNCIQLLRIEYQVGIPAGGYRI